MIKKIGLNEEWKVTWTDGVHGLRIKEEFYQYPLENDPGRYLDINLPVDMNEYMMEKGLLNDINVGNNHLHARWVSEQIWQFCKEFNLDKKEKHSKYYLNFERLDYRAHIYLNGALISIHENSYIPCKIDVSDRIVEGCNKIVVGLESGVYHTAEKPGQQYQNMIAGSLTKSQWLRKPLYQFGWDWNPILINVGITGNVYIESFTQNKIEQVSVFHELNDDLSNVRFIVKVALSENYPEKESAIKIKISDKDFVFPLNKLDEENCINVEFEFDNPRLWWPVNFGKQHLYTLEVQLLQFSEVIDSVIKKTGIRKVEIDRSTHPVKGEYFILKINNQPIFCKGANWVPPDVIYGKNNDQKIESLINLALEANFNILRIWGGGDYAPQKLLELCDEKGILIWHDFLFACFKFPGNDDEFTGNVKREVTWTTRQLSVHPSLVVWCGNNEVQWIYEQAEQKSFNQATDYNIYHQIIPQILNNENCSIPYWPGSPYSPGEIKNNASFIGDQHPWQFPLLENRLGMWQYRENEDRFPNEGGVLGVSPLDTLKDFTSGKQPVIRSFEWESHDNTCNYWDNDLGFCYQMLFEWLGLDYKKLSLEEYIYASSLIQSEGLMEYIMNYRCRKFDTSSAIFWMYNDSWPATHSWSIVDYYLRKKPAFYTVKRMNNPVFTGLRLDKEVVKVYVVNDLPSKQKVSFQTGLIDLLDSETIVHKSGEMELNPNSAEELFRYEKSSVPTNKRASLIPYSILFDSNGDVLSQSRLFLQKFKEMKFGKPEISIRTKNGSLEISSKTFVWAASFDSNGLNLQDNFIDLFPNQVYKIDAIFSQQPLEVRFTGNELINNLQKIEYK